MNGVEEGHHYTNNVVWEFHPTELQYKHLPSPVHALRMVCECLRCRSTKRARNSFEGSVKRSADAEWRKLSDYDRQQFVDDQVNCCQKTERSASFDYGFHVSLSAVRRLRKEDGSTNDQVPPAKKASHSGVESSGERPSAALSQAIKKSTVQNNLRQFLQVVAPETTLECLVTLDVVNNIIFMEALEEVAQKFALFTGSKVNYETMSDGRRTWGTTSSITKEKHRIATQMKETGGVICEVASIRLHPNRRSLGLSHIEVMKKQLMKNVVVRCKLLVKSMEHLEARFHCCVAQM